MLRYSTILITICDIHEAMLCNHLHSVSTYRNTNVKEAVDYIALSMP
jgi:hypothetical protein